MHSLGEMSAGEAEDGKWRRHFIRYDLHRIRELCRSSEDILSKVPRSMLFQFLLSWPFILLSTFWPTYRAKN